MISPSFVINFSSCINSIPVIHFDLFASSEGKVVLGFRSIIESSRIRVILEIGFGETDSIFYLYLLEKTYYHRKELGVLKAATGLPNLYPKVALNPSWLYFFFLNRISILYSELDSFPIQNSVFWQTTNELQ